MGAVPRKERQILRDVCHHKLQGYLAEYMERACIAETTRALLLEAIKLRPRGRGEAQLTKRLTCIKVACGPSCTCLRGNISTRTVRSRSHV